MTKLTIKSADLLKDEQKLCQFIANPKVIALHASSSYQLLFEILKDFGLRLNKTDKNVTVDFFLLEAFQAKNKLLNAILMSFYVIRNIYAFVSLSNTTQEENHSDDTIFVDKFTHSGAKIYVSYLQKKFHYLDLSKSFINLLIQSFQQSILKQITSSPETAERSFRKLASIKIIKQII